MRLAFVVPRYGPELDGGPEHQCRLIAERLAASHQVDVLTTCAIDSRSWANVHAEGADRLRGVTVRRFATARSADAAAIRRSADRVFFGRHDRQDEMEWLKQQGPWAPGLVDYLERQHQQYDVLIFFTYLYAPTVLGLRVAPSRACSCRPSRTSRQSDSDLIDDRLRERRGIVWNTEVERRLFVSAVSSPDACRGRRRLRRRSA